MIEQRVTLRYGAQQIPAIVQAVQGDTGRDVIFELADYEIPAGATANYYIDKPDGNAVYNSAEVISSTEILAHLTEQALAEPGRNNGQVRILSGGEVITSFDFVLEVEPFRGILRLQSETEVNIFDEALQAAAEDAIQEILDQTPVVTGMQNSIAPSYSASSTYAVGDYVMYNAQLYRCVTAITTAEAWTAAHWTQVPLVNDVNDLKSALKVSTTNLFNPDTSSYGWLYYLPNAGDPYDIRTATGGNFGQTAPIPVYEGEEIIIWGVTANTSDYTVVRLASNDVEDTLTGQKSVPVPVDGGSYWVYIVPADTPYISIGFLTTRIGNIYIGTRERLKTEENRKNIIRVPRNSMNVFDSRACHKGFLWYIADGVLTKLVRDDFGMSNILSVHEGDVLHIYGATNNTGGYWVASLNSDDIDDAANAYWVSALKEINGKSYCRFVVPTGVTLLSIGCMVANFNIMEVYVASKLNILPYTVINALGDSITQGYIRTDGGTDVWADPKWTQIVANNLGCTVNNYGISGTSICDGSSESFLARLNRMTETWIDCLVIFGGTNDYGDKRALTLGTISDTPAQGTNFYASFKNLVLSAINKYPMAQVLIVTPMRRYTNSPNQYGISMEDIVTAEVDVAKYYGVQCFDLYHNGGINPEIDSQKNAYTSDGLHPNQNGINRFLAPRLSNEIERLCACRA